MQTLVFLTFFSKVIEEEPLGCQLDLAPLVKEGLKYQINQKSVKLGKFESITLIIQFG